MSGIGVQLAPRPGPSVVFGEDAADPDRFLVRGRLLRPRLLVGLVILYFACFSQLAAWREAALWRLTGATCLAFGAVALAFVRKRLVLDRGRGGLREELSILFPFAWRERALQIFRRVIVSVENQPASQGHETVYPVDLQASATRVRVDAVGQWEHAVPLAEALARFLRVPLRDDRRGGEMDVEELDALLRDDTSLPGEAPPPERLAGRVSVDRPALLRVEIPRPAVAQTLFLNAIVLVFCILPLLAEIGIPLLRGGPPGSLREAFLSVGWLLLPALIVGGGSLLHVARNGGTLSVTPECARFLRHGVLWRREVSIPADSLENVVLLDPEMGGARSLLAYFSSGVLVARSDTQSFRVGYGLSAEELQWLRRRICEVIGQARRRASAPPDSHPESAPPDAGRTVFPRWSRVGVGLLVGGVVGRLAGGPLGVCVTLPHLEHLLNVGAVLGFLGGAAFASSLWRDPAARRVLSAASVGLVGAAIFGLAWGGGLVQPAARVGPRVALTGSPSSKPSKAAWIEERERLGFFCVGTLGNALALNVLLLIALRTKGGEWRPDLATIAADGARTLRRSEGLAPPPIVVGLALSAVVVMGLSSTEWRARPPSGTASRPLSTRDLARTPMPATAPPQPRAIPSRRPAAPEAALPVVPRIETVRDLDSVLAGLSGRPAVLLYWAGDEPLLWLPDVDRLYRTYALRGVEVIGIPSLQDEARLRQTLVASRIGWRQLLGAAGSSSRIPTAWPQAVVLAPDGEVAYRGRPGAKVDEALARLVGPAAQQAPEVRGVVEGQLLYAGRPLHDTTRQPVRLWFRNEWTGREAQLDVEVNQAGSTFRWTGPAGSYLVDASSGARLDAPPHVSYSGTSTFAITAGEPRRQDVSLHRILRLRQPVDNGATLPALGQTPAHASPVRFAWDGVPEAALYRYSILRSGGRASDPVASGETRSPAIEIPLAAGKYRFDLSARGPAGLVGRLEVYGANYRAWSYEFEVK